MSHQITTPGRGPQRGQVTCHEDPGQTCLRKDMGNGVYLCKCYPTACGSAWAQIPGCNTITWKEPVIDPQVGPRPIQSRPPARGRPASVPPAVWKRLKRRARNAARSRNPAPSQVLSVPTGQQGGVSCPEGYILDCWKDEIDNPGVIFCICQTPGCISEEWFGVCLTAEPTQQPAPKCPYQTRWCESLGICVPDVPGACPTPPDFTAQPRPMPAPQPRPQPRPAVLSPARPSSAPRPSAVPRPPSRGAQLQRAATAVRRPS